MIPIFFCHIFLVIDVDAVNIKTIIYVWLTQPLLKSLIQTYSFYNAVSLRRIVLYPHF